MADLAFWKGKRVLVTGHTGFKGSWFCQVLLKFGAEVIGYSLEPPTNPNLFQLSELEKKVKSVTADIRDKDALFSVFEKEQPDIVVHMAAQPIVRESYRDPVYTYETNVMGTVNILECIRNSGCVRSFLNVTTDKVYENHEWFWGYRETDPLNGFDPYSNSKSCAELVTHSYRSSFFSDGSVAISTARAGNVIGGGDFAVDRIIPDCVRAASKAEPIVVRNPYSIRPYQHVLEPLSAYLMIAQRQYEDSSYADSYNIGPEDADCISTGKLVDLFCKAWGNEQAWENKSTGGPHEAGFLKLDCSKVKTVFNWKPKWSIQEAISKTVQWTQVYLQNGDIQKIMDKQIVEFFMTECAE